MNSITFISLLSSMLVMAKCLFPFNSKNERMFSIIVSFLKLALASIEWKDMNGWISIIHKTKENNILFCRGCKNKINWRRCEDLLRTLCFIHCISFSYRSQLVMFSSAELDTLFSSFDWQFVNFNSTTPNKLFQYYHPCILNVQRANILT